MSNVDIFSQYYYIYFPPFIIFSENSLALKSTLSTLSFIINTLSIYFRHKNDIKIDKLCRFCKIKTKKRGVLEKTPHKLKHTMRNYMQQSPSILSSILLPSATASA